MPTRVKVESIVAIIVLGFAIGFLHWKVDRWLNWKLDHGSHVEQRIQGLERRIDALEAKCQ